jgi:hypothetical protein
MALAVWPSSPTPAGQSVQPAVWGVQAQQFDSGAYHSTTTRSRPLYTSWSIPWRNIPREKRDVIVGFVNSMKAGGTPFLIKHHEDYRVNSVLVASAGYVSGTSFFLYDTNSFFIRADTTTIGSLFSTLSAYVTLGAEYNYDQDTGIITANTIDATDVWRAESLQYFKKVYITRDYRETGIIEGQWSAALQIAEVT